MLCSAFTAAMLGLTLLAAPAPAPAAAPAGTTPVLALAPRVRLLTAYLGQSLGLAPAQLPALELVVSRHLTATTQLNRQGFATPAAASAAQTVLETRFWDELRRVLTYAQFQGFMRLDMKPAARLGC